MESSRVKDKKSRKKSSRRNNYDSDDSILKLSLNVPKSKNKKRNKSHRDKSRDSKSLDIARKSKKKSSKSNKKNKLFKIEPTAENIAFLKNIYEQGRSAKAKELQQKEEEEMNRQNVWWRRFFCPCLIKNEDDEGSIQDITFSSGESNASDV